MTIVVVIIIIIIIIILIIYTFLYLQRRWQRDGALSVCDDIDWLLCLEGRCLGLVLGTLGLVLGTRGLVNKVQR